MKLILLVGFSKGLGRAIFEQLLVGLEGGRRELLAAGRNTNKLPSYEGVTYLEVDLLKSDCWDSILTYIPNNIESLDIFYNAGVIEPIGVVGTLNNSRLENAIKVNYSSPMKLINKLVSTQKKLAFLLNIYNITSGASTTPVEGWSLYCSTKAAFRMFLDVAEKESKGTIAVKHIDPGVVDTDMQSTIRSKSSKEMKYVHKFIQLKESNSLQSPKEAATEVLVKSGHK
jgi:NADP-dependent 3-hydroxy acid dehydrogenase YdfG